MLKWCDFSSLVVDRLCDHARGQNTAVTGFYFDFAARKGAICDQYAWFLAETGR